MSRVLDEHRQYLQDDRRIAAFARSIADAVRPGEVVVDLGCGTGILGLMACRAGASRVYAIDQGEMAEVARDIAAANGFADRVIVVRGHSLTVTLPEPADLVVSDQLGHFGWEAGGLEYFEDARRRFLKPEGRLLPRRVALWMAPVEAPAVHADARFWSAAPGGFDMQPAQEIAWNSGYPRMLSPDALLAAGQCGATLELGARHAHVSVRVSFTTARAGALHGVAGWFEAALDDRTILTNAPAHPERIERRQAVFIVPDAPQVPAGTRIDVEMSIRPADLLASWTVAWTERGVTRQHRGSTFRGMPIAADDLRRTRPSFVPRLSPRGEARRLVIDAIDGHRTVADIERLVLDRHADLFHTPADAARFVAEVVTRYAE